MKISCKKKSEIVEDLSIRLEVENSTHELEALDLFCCPCVVGRGDRKVSNEGFLSSLLLNLKIEIGKTRVGECSLVSIAVTVQGLATLAFSPPIQTYFGDKPFKFNLGAVKASKEIMSQELGAISQDEEESLC